MPDLESQDTPYEIRRGENEDDHEAWLEELRRDRAGYPNLRPGLRPLDPDDEPFPRRSAEASSPNKGMGSS